METNIFAAETIYIPFLNFYKDKVDFAILQYPDRKPISGPIVFTITCNFHKAIYKYSTDEATKIFNKHLKTLCPRKLWKNYGLIKTTISEFMNYKITYKKDNLIGEYVSVNELLNKFEIIKI